MNLVSKVSLIDLAGSERANNIKKNQSKNSRSDNSLSKGKQNKSAVLINIPKESSKVREEEMREALRKKREHRERLKVRNF